MISGGELLQQKSKNNKLSKIVSVRKYLSSRESLWYPTGYRNNLQVSTEIYKMPSGPNVSTQGQKQ